MTPEGLPDPLEIALRFTAILEGLGVRHLIGGSLASAVHGEPRSTNDVDILADIREPHVSPLIEALGGEYYASASAMREAIRSGGSFNVIHMNAAMKVDVFVAGSDPFDQERLDRRARIRVGSGPDSELWMDTAEHSVLRKLE